MKILSKLLFCLVLLMIGTVTGLGQNQSGLAEKDNVIAAARALETAPLDKNTAKLTEPALRWVIETKDISLIACSGSFTLFSDKKNKHSSLMTMSYMIGMAAYKLENPNNDENAVQLGGLETALKAYDTAVKEKPKTKSDQVEALLVKRANGELAAVVNAGDCGKK